MALSLQLTQEVQTGSGAVGKRKWLLGASEDNRSAAPGSVCLHNKHFLFRPEKIKVLTHLTLPVPVFSDVWRCCDDHQQCVDVQLLRDEKRQEVEQEVRLQVKCVCVMLPDEV